MVNSHVPTARAIEEGQRWVRQKLFGPLFAGLDPTFLRYHAKLSPETN
jgi:hypothetical protein